MVYFVGAGSGAVDLITVRGMRLLQKADVIIYAGSLVNPELLGYARKECEIYNSAKMTLDEVIDVMKDAHAKEKELVRLHTGDPSVYGAIREQMDALDELGIEYESCPGVSACFGAASSLNLEYTLPDISQSLIAHGGKNEGPAEGKYRKLRCTSGIHGHLSEHGNVKGIEQASDRRRIRSGDTCCNRI